MSRSMLSVLLAAGVMIGSPLCEANAGQRPATASAERVETGVVVSSSAAALIVRNDDGQYAVYALDRDTVRPRSIARGSHVRVVGRPGENGSAIPVAVSVVTTAEAGQDPGAVDDTVPPGVRRLERQIQRAARRYRLGGYGAVAMDPELVTLGARGTVGPLFDTTVSFRPNIQLGFGEITTLLGVDLDGVYHLARRGSPRTWTPYFGAGINLSFSHVNFNREEDGRSWDFGDYDLDSGINFIAGIENTNRVFIELVSTAYAAPHVRFIVGINFW